MDRKTALCNAFSCGVISCGILEDDCVEVDILKFISDLNVPRPEKKANIPILVIVYYMCP